MQAGHTHQSPEIINFFFSVEGRTQSQYNWDIFKEKEKEKDMGQTVSLASNCAQLKCRTCSL
jgi:hypothetical protein